MTLSIRPAQSGDVAIILGFIHELAAFEKLAHEVEATEALIETAFFGQTPQACCAIAEWNGAPVGLALWYRNFSSFRGRSGVYLEDLFVRETHRGHGAGTALLRHVAGYCLENGGARLDWAVLDWNDKAIAFYEAHGATVLPDWRICRVGGAALAALAQRVI